MKATKEAPIRKPRAYEPRRNLPQFNPWKGAESRFALQFARAYRAGFMSLPDHRPQDEMAFAREIPANGYGIADLVSVAWKAPRGQRGPRPVEDFILKAEHTLRAFELKVSDWRRALQQASRYRFFAHVPIAVLPAGRSRRALENLETFKVLGVGLWTFHPESGVIKAHFTPSKDRPRDTRHHVRTLRLLAKVTKALPIA